MNKNIFFSKVFAFFCHFFPMFSVPSPQNDVRPCLGFRMFSHEAKAVLHYEVSETYSKLESFRERAELSVAIGWGGRTSYRNEP